MASGSGKERCEADQGDEVSGTPPSFGRIGDTARARLCDLLIVEGAFTQRSDSILLGMGVQSCRDAIDALEAIAVDLGWGDTDGSVLELPTVDRVGGQPRHIAHIALLSFVITMTVRPWDPHRDSKDLRQFSFSTDQRAEQHIVSVAESRGYDALMKLRNNLISHQAPSTYSVSHSGRGMARIVLHYSAVGYCREVLVGTFKLLEVANSFKSKE